jgi:hypothetical protein
MLLNLQTPIGTDFLKNWPSQNAVNCDALDAYAGPCLVTHPIQTYTPALTASTTNPSLGTGSTLIGQYYTVFDQVYTWGEFRFGTSASVGSGIYEISLPFRAKTLIGIGPSSLYTSGPVVGNGTVFQLAADANRQPVTAVLRSLDKLAFSVHMGTAGASRGVSHNIPIAWSGAGAPGDGLFWSARYQREE